MPPKLKKQKSTATPTTMKGKSADRRKRQPSHPPPADTDASSMEEEEEPSLKPWIEEWAIVSRDFFTSLTGPSASRSSVATREAVPDNFLGVAKEVRARVASWPRGALVPFIQTDEEAASDENQAVSKCMKRISNLVSCIQLTQL